MLLFFYLLVFLQWHAKEVLPLCRASNANVAITGIATVFNIVTSNNGNDSELMKREQKKHTVPSCANCRQTSDTSIPKNMSSLNMLMDWLTGF